MHITWLILPDFLVILLGWLLYNRFGFSRSFFSELEKLIFYVLFPILLFQSILKAPLSADSALEITIASYSVAIFGYFLSQLAGRISKATPLALASVTQCAFGFNSYIGLAVAKGIAGTQGQSLMAVIVGISVPVVNTLSIYPLARHQQAHVLGAIVRNPFVIATVLGLAGNVAGLQLPGPIDSTLSRLGSAAIALGILCIGPSLNWQASRSNETLIASMVIIKLVLLPAFALAISMLLGLDQTTRLILVLFAGLPCASTGYVLAMRMGGDGRIVSLIISIGTLACAFTIALWMNWLT